MKQHFNSNETLEMCDVVVSQDGRIEVKTKSYHTAEIQRLGTPKGAIRGRVQVEGVNFLFAPYAEGARKPTFSQTVVVGSTSLQCTEDNVKVSFKVPRHLSKPLMVMYIQSEIDEVKRRLNEDVYDKLMKKTNDNDNVNDNSRPDGEVNVNVNVDVEKKGGTE